MTTQFGCNSLHKVFERPSSHKPTERRQMDPGSLLYFEWSELGKLLINLWIIVGLVVFCVANMLIGHVLIPSLVATFEIPASIQKVRPLFLALALGSFGLATFVLLQVINLAGVISRFWSDYWI